MPSPGAQCACGWLPPQCFQVSALLFQGSLQPAESLVYFENKKMRYIWDADAKAFSRLRGFDRNVPCSYFHQQKGISLQEQVVR